MDAAIIGPFIEATTYVLQTMAATNCEVGAPTAKTNDLTWGSVTGSIGLAGQNTIGNLTLSFDEASILDIVSKMLMSDYQAINNDVIDAVGEITNMVCGDTKKRLAEHGFIFDMATPLIIVGKGIALSQRAHKEVIHVPFKTPAGNFVLETNISKRSN